jgi:hypothetical protein
MTATLNDYLASMCRSMGQAIVHDHFCVPMGARRKMPGCVDSNVVTVERAQATLHRIS